jgi:cell division protein FtsA
MDAVLYYIQESGLQNSLRSGIVITGGGAELANFISLVKEMSGYEVRKGYPRFMFSASVGSGVYATGATSAIGMVLAAKEDNLPDCVSVPERVVEEEEDMMVVEVTDETPAQNTISDEDLAKGETGNLISPDDFGEPVKKEKKKTTKVKVKKRPGILGIAWTKIKSTALDFYDDENKDNTEE